MKLKHCQLCDREVSLTFHHLIPRKVHRRKRFQKTFSKKALNKGVWVCRQCHRGIHKLYDEMTLALRLNHLQALKEDDALQKHISWVKKQKEQK
jgi:rubrerythrin